ncbi:MAG: T9SS type A sorting domain-containing protein [Bacteroidetes bacterium]|nr:MAG: T9SS type A sorting domain-containing protein [Bacteroidota bacterium]
MKIQYLFILVVLFINFLLLKSQNYYDIPISFNYSSTISPLTPDSLLDTKVMPLVNVDSLLQIERDLDSAGVIHPHFYGYGFTVNFTLSNSGTWDTLESGDRLWRLKIICPESYEINFVFHNFKMADSIFVFVYDSTKTFVLGPYNVKDNDTSNYYTTHLVRDNIAYIEYYEPQNCNQERYLEVEQVVSGYKNLFCENDSMQYKKNIVDNILTNWDDCYRDANCPEGNDRCREKYSIVWGIRYFYSPTLWTSFSNVLINNTNPDDYRLILLTAGHSVIGDEWTLQNMSSYRFGYMREYCKSGNIMKFWDFSCANRLIADFYNTDLALIQIRRNLYPGDFYSYPDMLYWSGWNKSNSHIPSNTTNLNYPGLYPLQIAIDNESPVICGEPDKNCNEDNTDYFWKVRFNSGMATHGSSGSPIYNENHEIVGALHGSCTADCDHTNDPIYFGRFSRFWDFIDIYDNTVATFLDPGNSGYNTVKGKKLPVNIYGRFFHEHDYYHAFNKIRFGSRNYGSFVLPFYLGPLGPSLLTIKAGEEIIFRPCTQILEGANMHAYIQPTGCDFNPVASDPDDVYTTDCGETSIVGKNDFDNNYSSKIIEETQEKTYFDCIPNPAFSSIDVVYKLPTEGSMQLIITNSYGQQVYNANLNYAKAKNEQRFSIDISSFPSGLYFVVLRSQNIVQSKQVVIVK